ncbi:MAG: hypothetical protein KDD43_11715, partial [Bdellovibrionales bacterium]|nr:hypothetical protein [Bdellovibrionales bacterium]
LPIHTGQDKPLLYPVRNNGIITGIMAVTKNDVKVYTHYTDKGGTKHLIKDLEQMQAASCETKIKRFHFKVPGTDDHNKIAYIPGFHPVHSIDVGTALIAALGVLTVADARSKGIYVNPDEHSLLSIAAVKTMEGAVTPDLSRTLHPPRRASQINDWALELQTGAKRYTGQEAKTCKHLTRDSFQIFDQEAITLETADVIPVSEDRLKTLELAVELTMGSINVKQEKYIGPARTVEKLRSDCAPFASAQEVATILDPPSVPHGQTTRRRLATESTR